MLSSMGATQLYGWVAFHRDNGFEVETTNHLLGELCSLASIPYVKKGSKPLEPKDFYPPALVRKKPQQTWQEQKAIGMSIAASYKKPNG